MNGTMYRKSRYFTFSAASQNPKPKDASNARNRKNGKVTIRQSGINWYQIIKTARITKEIRKSTKLTITALAGIIIRGKYTFDSIFAFVINELLLSVSEFAKNCQGSIAT